MLFTHKLALLLVATVMSHKYAPPPFAILVQNAGGGGLYTGGNNFSRDYTLPVKHDLIVGGGWGQVQDGEMLQTLAVG